MKNLKPLIIILAVTLLSLTACAPTRQVVQPAPAPLPEPLEKRDAAIEEPAVSKADVVEMLSRFNLRMLTEPDEPCPGPDGKYMITLGRNYQVQFVLEFPGGAPPAVKSENLVARIDGVHAPFHFIRKISETEFVTARTRLDFLEPGLTIGPARVSLFHKDRAGETFLGEMGRVVVDTTPPPSPTNIRITKSGAGYFVATWDLETVTDARDGKEIIIKKMAAGSWQSVWRGASLPPVTLQTGPAGQFRIVVVDCALNRAWTDFTPDVIAITRRACGGTREEARANAKKRIEEAFYDERVQPFLKDAAGLASGAGIPPGIAYTSINETLEVHQAGELCVDVTGRLNRERFDEWLETLSQQLENRGKKKIRLHAEGHGSDILASLFKSRFASRGYAIHDESDVMETEPAGSLTISVALGPPSPLSHSMVDIYCWHVRATISFTSESQGRIHISHMTVDELDPRIYGPTLHQALYGQGLNSFTDRVAKPMLDDFFRRWP